jgi:cytidylate kinase
LSKAPGAAKPVIAIDGPAGSGKSTVARLAAKALGFDYVDTGAMYRAITYAALIKDIDSGDVDRLNLLADETIITFKSKADGAQHVFLNGKDVTAGIRMPDVTANVSAVSSHAGVREGLVRHQRELAAAAKHGVVVEGRDVGTVVFPNAMVKLYLDASVEERARRRQRDMADAGVKVDRNELISLLKIRDKKDSSRDISPLAKAPDAIIVDTTDLSIAETVGLVVRISQEKEGKV